MPMATTNSMRPDPRVYPTGGPVGGSKSRPGLGREEHADGGQARRRIALACARCRKRKIRCSGDPGNGSGCSSCKQAGVEPAECQFHRVGSDFAPIVLDNREIANNLRSIATSQQMVPIYNHANGPLYSRTEHHPYPQAWTVPYSEDTSPVDTYNLDQSTAYLPDQGLENPHTYNSNCQWSQVSDKPYQGGPNAYTEHDPVPVLAAPGLPYVQTNIQTAAETLSPLNMTALQASLPGGSHLRPVHSSDQIVPRRQLPMPQPSPAQLSRNVVDQLQDQRLRSNKITGMSSHGRSRPFPKLALPFGGDGEAKAAAHIQNPGSDLATQVTVSASTTNSPDGTMGYLPIAPSVSQEATLEARTQAQLNFSTSSLFEVMPAPAIPNTYSNFRNYDLPTCSSTETLTIPARQNSQTGIYEFTPKCDSSGTPANGSVLVSGHPYTPLSPNGLHHQPSLRGLPQSSLETKALSHRASTPNLNRGY
jgi:hypothetical protein